MTSFGRRPLCAAGLPSATVCTTTPPIAIGVAQDRALERGMNLSGALGIGAVALADHRRDAARLAFANQADFDFLADAQQADACCAARMRWSRCDR